MVQQCTESKYCSRIKKHKLCRVNKHKIALNKIDDKYGGSSLSCWYLYIKDTFELNLKVRGSLNFKNKIDFEFSVKVKIVCILKWDYFLIDFESKKKFQFWKWNLYSIFRGKHKLKLENIF